MLADGGLWEAPGTPLKFLAGEYQFAFRDYVKDTDYHRRSKSTVAVISPLGEHIVVRVHAQNADVRKAVCGLCFEHCLY